MRFKFIFSKFEYDAQPQARAQRPRQSKPNRATQSRHPQHQQGVGHHERLQPPQPQYMPSASTSRYVQRQPLAPPSPTLSPIVHDQGELDPFERSYLEDNPVLKAVPAPVSRAVSPPQQLLMRTSAELNMKSVIEPRPYSTSPDHGNQVQKNPDESGEGDEPADGSQFFPGSGFGSF